MEWKMWCLERHNAIGIIIYVLLMVLLLLFLKRNNYQNQYVYKFQCDNNFLKIKWHNSLFELGFMLFVWYIFTPECYLWKKKLRLVYLAMWFFLGVCHICIQCRSARTHAHAHHVHVCHFGFFLNIDFVLLLVFFSIMLSSVIAVVIRSVAFKATVRNYRLFCW